MAQSYSSNVEYSAYQKLRERPFCRNGRIHRRLASLAEVERGHANVLEQLLRDPARWLLWINFDIAHDLKRERGQGRRLSFVLLEDRHSIIAECSSNKNMARERHFDAASESLLSGLGWRPATGWETTNWNYEADYEHRHRLSTLLSATARRVCKVASRDLVEVGMQPCNIDHA